MLHEHFNIALIIIIDEYDTPIQEGYNQHYYDKIIMFMRNLFSGGFKDNLYLSYGFLTGILRVAQESIFSGMNNLKINSILDDGYSNYFGFTPQEVQDMAVYYHSSDKYPDICQWYDGYRFGSREIFNPWSVISYFDNNCHPDTFWISTGSNEILKHILSMANEEITESLNKLLLGEKLLTQIDLNVVYPQLEEDPSFIFSFLLVAGYLKAESFHTPFSGDISLLQDAFQKYLYQTISFYDSSNENFYQGLLAGLLALMDDSYRITSNREAGDGRYDFQLEPRAKNLPGIIIEIKVTEKDTEEKLLLHAKQALEQIEKKKYSFDLEQLNNLPVFKYGIAFSGKHVKIIRGNM